MLKFLPLVFCLFAKWGFAASPVNYAPFAVPFDASKAGMELTERFQVKEYRYYTVILNFLHNGGEKAVELRQVLDDEEALFLKGTVATGTPVLVHLVIHNYLNRMKIFFLKNP